MEKITMEELMSEVDISRWRWSWIGDLNVVKELGDGRYLVRFNAHQIINDEPSLSVDDPNLGIITDAEGRTFQVTDWNDEHFVYCEVEKTDDGIIPVDTQFSF
ncbi:MAG TPA: hypothetical protein PLB70_05380 [Paludibacteraceae bacterium]|nr:hypothetical protein [Paludibacteraceae bacterium]